MNNLNAIFNEVIQSYNLVPFTPQEISSITEMFHNMTEQDIKNLADEYANEILNLEYETMYRD